MRAVNTVIQAAGLLKKSEPDLAEDLTMLRAIRDSNLPKFLKDDVLLFRAIIKDIFPGVQEPVAEYASLEAELRKFTEDAGEQYVPTFETKCIQLYEMTVVRHGMMLVGPTGGGKSRVLKSLQAAMSRIEGDPRFETVRVVKCNPKSITMNQLYGAFDLQTGEWSDGVAAVLIRHISAPNTEETGVTEGQIKWMVFDGPVDAIWIENMNTVLDDNKKLCLNSGEIIPLTDTNRRAHTRTHEREHACNLARAVASSPLPGQPAIAAHTDAALTILPLIERVCRIIFEVEDLAVASPATVSRCGMIYCEPAYLLPDRLAPQDAADVPLFKSWLQNMPAPLDSQRDAFKGFFQKYLVASTETLRLQLTQPVSADTHSSC
eukprot:2602070-Pleurochrysis_carterae.AAC.1